MRFLSRPLFSWLLALLLAPILLAPLHAQDGGPPPAPAAASSADTPDDDTPPPPSADQLNDALDKIKDKLTGNLSDGQLADLRGKAQAIQAQADQLGAALTPQSEALAAKLQVLGPAPEKGAPAEAPEVKAQRRQLDKAKADLDAQTKQAALLSQEAQQVATQIAVMRRDAFEQQLSSRTAPPLSGDFWQALGRSRSDDMNRLHWLSGAVADNLRQAWQPANRGALLGGLVAALLLLTVGRWLAERYLLQLIASRLPAGRLRRSAMATAVLLVSLLTVGLAAECGYLALNWNGIADDDLHQLYKHLVALACFCAFVAGLARGLLSVRRPSWRLPHLSNDAAWQLRHFPWLLAGATGLLFLIERINTTIGASLAAGVAANGVTALVISTLVAALLVRLGHARRALLAAGEEPAKRPLWVGLLVAAAFVSVALTWIGVVTGYIAFAAFLARQMLWSAVVLGALYLLLNLVDDLFETLLSPDGRAGQRLQQAFGVAPGRLTQSAALLSGIVRGLLVLLALSFLIMPFRTGPGDLLGRLGQLFAGQSLGALKIAPASLLQGLLVGVVGYVVLRLVKRWLDEQLLPRTELDAGMKNSISTLFGYVGGVLLLLLALATADVNLQSLTWIASALSVGIGFGLQSIVQNFISGLILLTERPVKVGDWISISGVEGDIKRISVRSTEILQGDRSTVIVPNSQLITSNVRNVTLGNAQGRVQIRLPMPLDTDAGKTRQLILDALAAHPSTLDNPAPSVQLDTLDASGMVFVATAYTRSPREVGGVRSDLLFDILQRLREAELPMSSPQNMVITTLRGQRGDPALQGGTPEPISPLNPG